MGDCLSVGARWWSCLPRMARATPSARAWRQPGPTSHSCYILDAIEITEEDATTAQIPVVLPDHLELLEQVTRAERCWSSWTCWLPLFGPVDSHKDQEIRRRCWPHWQPWPSAPRPPSSACAI